MGLAAAQARLLTITARKADCEYGVSIASMEKMAITREQSDLAQEYYSKLQTAKITYFANNQYNDMTYGYLMGYGANWTTITAGTAALKKDNSMILTDYKGSVVLNNSYANVIKQVLGDDCMNAQGRGGTFSVDKIPEMIAKLCSMDQNKIQAVIDNKKVNSSYDSYSINLLTGEETGESGVVDNTDSMTEKIQQLVDFYYPIFQAAAMNGWTTEYNTAMATNDDYISDALISGTFCLAKVNDEGTYEPNTSLSYFLTAGLIQERNDSDAREEINAWYNAEKSRIAEKENYLDITIRDYSTEIEAINTEIQSLQSLINDAVQSVFDWGSS